MRIAALLQIPLGILALLGAVSLAGCESLTRGAIFYQDEVIDVRHARALAASRPQAKFHLLQGGHNDWSAQPDALIRNIRP